MGNLYFPWANWTNVSNLPFALFACHTMPGTKQKRKRAAQKCSRCGQLRKGHTCSNPKEKKQRRWLIPTCALMTVKEVPVWHDVGAASTGMPSPSPCG